MPEKIVIVGGGQAGGRVAQILADSSKELDITLIGSEPYPPYNRPPLSKGVLLGTAKLSDCAIWSGEDAATRHVRFVGGRRVEALNLEAQRVVLDGGETVSYDKLVLATGSQARQLRVPGAEIAGVGTLRTFDDARRIAQQFHKGKRLLVVGGGFVGLEIAAAARAQGMETVVVEATNRLLSRIVPEEIGAALERCHSQAGVTFKVGAMVESLRSGRSGQLTSAVLSNGEIIKCDLAAIGVGATAETDLAKAAGLEVQVGIRTDECLRASAPNVYACGDVASFWHPLYLRYVRVEAWQNAEDHAQVVAGQILGQDTRCDSVPFFWSDQYDQSLQIVGIPYFGSQVIKIEVENAEVLYHLDARRRMVAATALGHHSAIGRKISEARRLIKLKVEVNPQDLLDGTAPKKLEL